MILNLYCRFWNARFERHVLWLRLTIDLQKYRKIHFTDSYVSIKIFRISKYLWKSTRETRSLRIQFFLYVWDKRQMTRKMMKNYNVMQQQKKIQKMKKNPFTHIHTKHTNFIKENTVSWSLVIKKKKRN